MTVQITESSGALEAMDDGSVRVVLIDEGQGSSGIYPRETLELAESEGVFTAGLHAYLDHPTATEAAERPERSVMDMCGTYTVPGKCKVVEGKRQLESVFKPYPSLRDPIMERINDIGFSIRAEGEISESDGKTIQRITKVHSVDLVTRAGRGGRALNESARELLESTRRELIERNGGEYKPRHASKPVQEATDNDVRRYLSDAVDNAHEGEESFAYLQDFDDTYVYFRKSMWDGDRRWGAEYRQTYTRDGVNVTLTGEPAEVKPETTFTPTNPESDTSPAPAVESAPRATTGGSMEIKEAEYQRLSEAAERVQALESERDAEKVRADEAETRLAEAARENVKTKAEAIVAEAFTGIDAPKAKARLVESAVSADEFDADTFKTEVEESASEFTPAGVKVEGFGDTAPVSESEMTEDEFRKAAVAILEGR